MDKSQKRKTLTYRRAVYVGKQEAILEDSLREAHKKRPDISQRIFEAPNQPTIECRNFYDTEKKGVFLHLASYHPGERASTLKKLRGVSIGEVETTPPPDGFEFMDGDLMVYVVDNHVLLCATNLHEKKAERYMADIIEAAGLGSEASKFSLSKVGDANKAKILQRQGVKRIHLNASIFDATLDYNERQSVASRITGGFMDEIKALIKKDIPDIDIEKAENLTAHIVLSYNSRKKKMVLGRQVLDGMAKQMVEEDDDGFMIETLGGEKIRHSEISVSKPTFLPKWGKSVQRQDAWRALEEYYCELQAGGILEQ